MRTYLITCLLFLIHLSVFTQSIIEDKERKHFIGINFSFYQENIRGYLFGESPFGEEGTIDNIFDLVYSRTINQKWELDFGRNLKLGGRAGSRKLSFVNFNPDME
jgi:hypothetical protein